jgi:Spy/CpxP family protein refolding chaperone
MPPDALRKMQGSAKKASADIEAVLTPAQRSAFPRALTEIGALRQARIPVEALGELKLTTSQRAKIVAVSEKSQKFVQAIIRDANGDFRSLGPVLQAEGQKTHTDAMAILTPSQRSVIDRYEKAHPRRGFGGGFGGRRGGRGGPGGPGRGPGRPTI